MFMENTVTIDWEKIDEIIEKYNSNREALLMVQRCHFLQNHKFGTSRKIYYQRLHRYCVSCAGG